MELTNSNKKKKILIFVPEFPVLTETFIARDISKLISLNTLDISILAMKQGSGALSNLLEKHFIKSRLSVWDSLIASFYFITKPKKVFQAYKLVLKDKSKSLLKRKYLFLKSVGYTRVFHKHHPDEIHVHFLSDPSTIAMVASIILDIPFSINAHARDVTEYPSLPQEKLRRCKFITVCNTHAYNALLKFDSQFSNKIKMIRHGVDEQDIFSSKLELSKPDRPVIISGGTRLVEKKGLEYLINASEILKKRGVDHEVHITGPGVLYTKLVNLISDKDLQQTVFIHGEGNGLPYEKVSQYYRIADILVLPSIELDSGDADGIPNALVEASFSKLAIITTNAGSISELIQNGINGIVVPQRNSEVIATEIEKLIFDVERRKSLGENAYAKAKEMFDIDRNVGLLSDIMQLD